MIQYSHDQISDLFKIFIKDIVVGSLIATISFLDACKRFFIWFSI